MADSLRFSVAIVDYGLGNLFSVSQACRYAGHLAAITSSPHEVAQADAVILPGVGAFGDAMEQLERLDLVSPLRDIVVAGKPLMAICLGMQLLMSESCEFGKHRGLGIIEGPVIRLDGSPESGDGYRNIAASRLKVPQVGWNRIFRKNCRAAESEQSASWADSWSSSPLAGLRDGEFMYFAHSYYPCPQDASVELSVSRYGGVEYCSSLKYRNIFACQFHPERSGPQGLQIYRNLASASGGLVAPRMVEDV